MQLLPSCMQNTLFVQAPSTRKCFHSKTVFPLRFDLPSTSKRRKDKLSENISLSQHLFWNLEISFVCIFKRRFLVNATEMSIKNKAVTSGSLGVTEQSARGMSFHPRTWHKQRYSKDNRGFLSTAILFVSNKTPFSAVRGWLLFQSNAYGYPPPPSQWYFVYGFKRNRYGTQV